MILRHWAKLNFVGTNILVTTNQFVAVARTFSFFFSTLDLAADMSYCTEPFWNTHPLTRIGYLLAAVGFPLLWHFSLGVTVLNLATSIGLLGFRFLLSVPLLSFSTDHLARWRAISYLSYLCSLGKSTSLKVVWVSLCSFHLRS